MAPFKILNGRDPPPEVKYDSESNTSLNIHDLLQKHDAILGQLKQNLIKAQQRMKNL